MTQAMLWWIATALVVAAELATGTFYLLMVATGLAGAAIAAHLGGSLAAQFATAAVVGGAAVFCWHAWRNRQPAPLPSDRNPDVNLDIGQRVHVVQWHSDGTTRVQYRGASWMGRYQGGGAPAPGEYLIQAIDGSELLLGR
jgi:membrane protein implicated in regulation of membrane protease activity